jgi:hypothetical protein
LVLTEELALQSDVVASPRSASLFLEARLGFGFLFSAPLLLLLPLPLFLFPLPSLLVGLAALLVTQSLCLLFPSALFFRPSSRLIGLELSLLSALLRLGFVSQAFFFSFLFPP